jgi:hypothetical protein
VPDQRPKAGPLGDVVGLAGAPGLWRGVIVPPSLGKLDLLCRTTAPGGQLPSAETVKIGSPKEALLLGLVLRLRAKRGAAECYCRC